MAFFGLTALGPQNAFAAASVHHRTIQIFDDNDFQAAWDRVIGTKISFATKEKIHDVLKQLYRGPIPANDLHAVDSAFELTFNGDDTITVDQYLKVMDGLRKEAEEEEKMNEGKAKPGCEFISSSEFRESLRKNAAIKVNPQKKLVAPLTAMQEVRHNPTKMIFGFPSLH